MCGRYASARKRIELLEEFRIERDRVSEPLEPDYNVAPTKRVYAVVTREARHSDGAGGQARGAAEAASAPDAGQAGVARELRVVRWGLVPFWAKDPKIGSRMINARAETVDSKPAFRHAFKRRRCLLPADGYYEWQRPDGSSEDKPAGKAQNSRTSSPAAMAARWHSLASMSSGGMPHCPKIMSGRGSGRPRSSPRARRTNWARSTTGCPW